MAAKKSRSREKAQTPRGEEKTSLAEWVRAVRESMTQEVFAEKLGTIRETVAKWEAGTSEPSWNYIEKIVEKFPYAALVDGAPLQFRDLDLQQVATRRYAREFSSDSSNAGAMLAYMAEVTPDGVDRRTGLPYGLDFFLDKYGGHLTMREKTFLVCARFKMDGHFMMAEEDWWMFLKFLGRGYYLGQASIAPPEVTRLIDESQHRRWAEKREIQTDLALDSMTRIREGRWLPVHVEALHQFVRYAARLRDKGIPLSEREADTEERVKRVLAAPLPTTKYPE